MIGIFVTPRRRMRKPSTPGQTDTFPPALTSLANDETRSEFSFFCNEAGTLHWVLDNTANYVDADTLIAAQPGGEVSGSDAAVAGMNFVSMDTTGVAAGAWRLHVGVIDAAGNASSVLSGDFTFGSGHLELNGDLLEWNGDALIFNAA